jgi:Electron transfer DM13
MRGSDGAIATLRIRRRLRVGRHRSWGQIAPPRKNCVALVLQRSRRLVTAIRRTGGTMIRRVLLLLSHIVAAAIGFMAGIYWLPIMVEPEAPAAAEVQALEASARFTGQFRRDLPGSDFLHWGEGMVAVGPNSVSLRGELAPGPDYKLYLSPEFVATKAEFQAVKPRAVRLGDVKTFTGFVVAVPPTVDIERYNTVVVWCEAFAQFISAAQYR